MTRAFVLDTGALDALGTGNSILARLVFGVPHDLDDAVTVLHRGPRLLAPALCLLRAARQRSRLAEHIGALVPLQVVPCDLMAIEALCGPLADLDDHVGHAVHIAGTHDASILTPTPTAYPESVRTVMLPT